MANPLTDNNLGGTIKDTATKAVTAAEGAVSSAVTNAQGVVTTAVDNAKQFVTTTLPGAVNSAVDKVKSLASGKVPAPLTSTDFAETLAEEDLPEDSLTPEEQAVLNGDSGEEGGGNTQEVDDPSGGGGSDWAGQTDEFGGLDDPPPPPPSTGDINASDPNAWGSEDTNGMAGDKPQPKNIQVEEGTRYTIHPIPNPLHEYASYTYALALHALSKQDYNDMVDNPGGGWIPTHTLIASGGKRGGLSSGFSRDPNWEEDFFFDDLKVSTIIGSSAGNNGTNAITLSFQLIEPYGMTLIDRLIDTARELDAPSYLELPYLLQIDFYGYDDAGTLYNVDGQRKFIPIKLIACKIKINGKGAEYGIEAVINPQQAYSDAVSSLPVNFEVSATTLTDFFKSDTADEATTKTLNQREESIQKSNQAAASGGTATADGSDNRFARQGTPAATSINTRSLVSAYNTWQELTVKNKNAVEYNTISIQVDERILASGGDVITPPKVESSKQVSEKDPNKNKTQSDVARGNANGGKSATPDFSKGKFTFNAGTSIPSIINTIMLSTEYIRKQIIDPEEDAQNNADKLKGPVQWWRIVPKVKFRKYDTQNKRQCYDTTYTIVPYTVYNRSHPDIPKAMPKGFIKDYYYIYTGKNNDILDFSIELDSTFYTAITVDRGAKTAATGPQAIPDQSTGSDEIVPEIPPGEDPARFKTASVNAPKTQPKGSQASAQSSVTTQKDSKAVAATSAAEHIKEGADTISVKLKIVGDPQFIKQDEVFYSPDAVKAEGGIYGEPGSLVGGSISTDGGQVHIRLTWKTPVDIDDVTGGLTESSKYKSSSLSGIYQVLTVDNTFSHGKFEQDIECIRLPDQPQDYEVASSTGADIRPAMPEQPNTPSSKSVGYEAYDEKTVTNENGSGEQTSSETTANTDGENSGPDDNTQVSQAPELDSNDPSAGEGSGDDAAALSRVAQSDSESPAGADTFDTSFA